MTNCTTLHSVLKNLVGLWVLFYLTLCISPSFAQQTKRVGEIKGRITIARSDDDVARPLSVDRYSTHRMPRTGSQSNRSASSTYKLSEKAAIYLESETLKGQKASPPASHPLLDQKDLTFHPQVLPILAGTTVDFPNRDNLFHNVFSYSQPREFDLGRYPTGESRSVRFDRPGVVRVYCDIHAQMNATILVLDNPYFAAPDDEGNYSIKNVPEGVHTIRFWYGREVVESRTVTVRSGDAATVNFTH